ncbi:hypothetical protein IWQ61_009974 [Dispira simplex]|nr:hypothetical protein IWQ61_009974 [Dispira simplex]
MMKIPAYPTPADSVLTGMSDEYLSSGPITDTADGKLSWSKELSGMPSPASSQRSRFSHRQSLRLRRKRWYQQYGATLSSAVEEGPGSRMHHTLSGISMSSTASSATVVSQLGFPREVSYSPYSPITSMEKPMTRISRLINSKPKPPHPPRLPLDVLLDQLGIPKTNPAQRPCIQGPKVLVRENSATGARRHTLRTMSSVDTLFHSPITVNKAASSKLPSEPPKSHDGRRNSEYLYDNNFGNLFRSSNVKRRSFHKSWKLSRLSLPGSPGKVHRVLRTLTRRLSRHVKVWSGA